MYYIPSDMVYRGSGETLSAAGDITGNAGESMGETPVHSGDNAVQLVAGWESLWLRLRYSFWQIP